MNIQKLKHRVMKKKIIVILFLMVSFPAFSQSKRADIDRQIQEIMKAREEMLKSLLNDSGFQNFDVDDDFSDLIKKFDQDRFAMPGMDMGAVVGEYDWRETDK